MDHIDLTMSTGYVRDWGFWEGVRELVQNAFDRERETEAGRDPVQRVMSDYRATIDYGDERLTIENAGTTIPRSTLLLGEGTKRQGGDTIGQHGEGYKLAMLALAREGYKVTVHNGPEIWRPLIVDSEHLGIKVLRISFEPGDENNTGLRFDVDGVDERQWFLVQDRVRRLHESGEELRGKNGWLFPSETEMGQLYVGGLWVTELNQQFLYGYDFDPQYLHLDRDRRTVDSFDLAWQVGELLRSLGLQAERFLLDSIRRTSADTSKLLNGASELLDKVYETLADDFIGHHGEAAFPVSTEWEATHVREHYAGVKPIVVDDVTKESITRSDRWKKHLRGLDKIEQKTPEMLLREFLEQYRDKFPQTLADAFATELIELAETERWYR